MNFYYLCIELVFSYHLKDDRTCFFSMYCNEEDVLKGLFTKIADGKMIPTWGQILVKALRFIGFSSPTLLFRSFGQADIRFIAKNLKSLGLHALAGLFKSAEIINDVTGLEGDPEMIRIARETGAGICAMHMQGTPKTMQINPTYENVVAEVYAYLEDQKNTFATAGIAPEKICLDPGIGFGKTHSHNIELMKYASKFLDLGCPILIGHSRKGFLGKLVKQTLHREPSLHERDIATAAAACSLADQGIHILRVHDVATVRLTLTAYASSRTSV